MIAVGGTERYSYPVREAGMPSMPGGDKRDGEETRRFRDLALPHLDEVYSLARYLLGNASDAEDAAQECYLRAFRHFASYHGPAIRPWLFAILRNVCHAARAGKSGLVFREEEPEDSAQPVWVEDREPPEGAALRRHTTETMRRLIEGLPAEFKEVVVLREINELSYRDIATVIEAPIGTVMSRLARGRALLRTAWIAAEGEDEAK